VSAHNSVGENVRLMELIYVQEEVLTRMLNKSQDPEANIEGGPVETQRRWWVLLKLDPDGQVRRL
jgi:hypothetical protein